MTSVWALQYEFKWWEGMMTLRKLLIVIILVSVRAPPFVGEEDEGQALMRVGALADRRADAAGGKLDAGAAGTLVCPSLHTVPASRYPSFPPISLPSPTHSPFLVLSLARSLPFAWPLPT